jgi:hypothetical protein
LDEIGMGLLELGLGSVVVGNLLAAVLRPVACQVLCSPSRCPDRGDVGGDVGLDL